MAPIMIPIMMGGVTATGGYIGLIPSVIYILVLLWALYELFWCINHPEHSPIELISNKIEQYIKHKKEKNEIINEIKRQEEEKLSHKRKRLEFKKKTGTGYYNHMRNLAGITKPKK